MYLAEVNIARLKAPLDHPDTAEFANNLERVNGLAERMEGFIWRHIDESGNATDTRIDEDPNVIVNLSVWRDVTALESFVWGTLHRQFYQKRDAWFKSLGSMGFAMWWGAPDHRPSVAEAAERLAHLNQHGDTDHAFGWAHLQDATRWQDLRCAPLAAE